MGNSGFPLDVPVAEGSSLLDNQGLPATDMNLVLGATKKNVQYLRGGAHGGNGRNEFH